MLDESLVKFLSRMTGKTIGITEKNSIHSLKQFYRWDFKDEEQGRRIIQDWSEKRIQKMHGYRKSYVSFWIYSFNLSTLKSFIENFNFMVITQMIIAGLAVWLFDYLDIAFNYHIGLFVSPIVFPLAFSINTDFQRREKVLDDLASFKSAALLWFFCMREWRETAGLDVEWLEGVKKKVHSIMFLLREYLLTDKVKRRDIIARYMYEDFSDISQLIESVRKSKLPANTSIVSRVLHFLNNLNLSFERLRVIREYRSPRSIRSFNKVLILFLPIILCPYFVYLGRTNEVIGWGPYALAVIVAGVFGALQGVQDKLDNPFDGMSEDDINLDTIDEWTFNSLQTAADRNYYTVGRFHVSANIEKEAPPKQRTKSIAQLFQEELQEEEGTDRIHIANPKRSPLPSRKLRKSIFKRSVKPHKRKSVNRSFTFGGVDTSAARNRFSSTHSQTSHPFAQMLENISGETKIERKHTVRHHPIDRQLSLEPTPSEAMMVYETPFKSVSEHSLSSLVKEGNIPSENRKSINVSFVTEPELYTYEKNSTLPKKTPLMVNNTSKEPLIPRDEQEPLGGRFRTIKVKSNENENEIELKENHCRPERTSLLAHNELEEVIIDKELSPSNDNVFT